RVLQRHSRRAAPPPPFPYTARCRSVDAGWDLARDRIRSHAPEDDVGRGGDHHPRDEERLGARHAAKTAHALGGAQGTCAPPRSRSEEHTSELQSLTNLVCRLLLEQN